MSQHLAVLIPGFLGFERGDNFSQFADRVSSALRAPLEEQLGQSVPVITVASLPTSSFADRQQALLAQIAQQTRRSAGDEQLHLVGHGIGGIDAFLMSCAQPLGAESWDALPGRDPGGIAARVRSVVSIATPHRGMELANATGAGSLSPAGMLRDPMGALHVLDLLRLLMGSALSTIDPRDLRYGTLRESRKVSHFVAELVRWQGLLQALTPVAMADLYRSVEPREGVRRRSFVTVAGTPRSSAPSAQPDAFFLECARRAAGSTTRFLETGPGSVACLERIRARAAEEGGVLVSDRAALPSVLDSTSSDGIVNTARQLFSSTDPDELAQVVVGDHFDVLGYYHRTAYTQDTEGQELRRSLNSGLLRSGSHFRDAEFFALYRAVATAITSTEKRKGRTRTGGGARKSRPASRPSSS